MSELGFRRLQVERTCPTIPNGSNAKTRKGLTDTGAKMVQTLAIDNASAVL